MSHFSVLVITDTPEQLNATLQPFHEYECTGVKDKYVIWVPAEEDLEAEFKEESDNYATLADFARDYYGYEVNEKGEIGRFTNPNRQWDWWMLGGRWQGYLLASQGIKGERGLMGSHAGEGVDQCLFKDLLIESMQDRAVRKAQAEWNVAKAAFGDLTWTSWKKARNESDNIDAAREFYNNQPAIIALKKAFDHPFHDKDVYLDGEEALIKSAKDGALSTFAVLKDGKWYERGDMGWFGCISDEKEQSEWDIEFSQLLSDIKPEQVISVVDCHI